MYYGLAGVMLLLLALQWWRVTRKQDEVFSEYEEQFPGKCGICAFHEFRIREFGRPRTAPPDHRCKEGLRRFRGVLH